MCLSFKKYVSYFLCVISWNSNSKIASRIVFTDGLEMVDEDQAAFDFHHGTESYQTATKRFVEWLASPVEIRRLTPFAGFASR